VEALGVLEVVEEAAWRRDEDIDAPDELLSLCAPVGASHDEAKGLPVVPNQLLELAVDLAGGRGEGRGWGGKAGRAMGCRLLLACTCSASSRVGVMTRAPRPLRALNWT
jgi:hypothetical protein